MTVAQQLTADRMLAAKGQTVTLTRMVAVGYDPSTGNASAFPVTQTGKGVILDFATGLRKQAGTTIPAAARQCFLSPLDVTGAAMALPQVDDTLTDARGRVYVVSDVSEIAPAGDAVLYTLTVRANA